MDLDELYEIQQNEIEALKAIFMDDYKEVVNQTPWKASSTVVLCFTDSSLRSRT